MGDASSSALLAPIDIGSVRVRNRVMMSTHGTRLSPHRYQRYLAERVAGGVGLVGLPAGFGVGEVTVGPGRTVPGYVGDWDAVPPDPTTTQGIEHYDRTIIPTLAAQADAVHAHGGRCIGQLYHPGAARNVENLRAAASPEILDGESLERILMAFGHGARRVREAGVDGVEIHAAHGYLVQQFIESGRIDVALRLLERVLEAAAGRPVGVRVNGEIADLPAVAARLVSTGAAYIHVTGGTYTGYGSAVGRAYVSASYQAPAPNAEAAAAVREVVDVPVIVAGQIKDLELAGTLVAEGRADMVGVVRALIAEPRLVALAEEGTATAGAPCIGGNECHYPGRSVVCAVNPDAGREEELELAPAATRRRVVVVGAGPAGVQAAWRAADRGHDVVVLEREDHVGGAVGQLAGDPARPELARYVEHLARLLDDHRVDVRLGCDADEDVVLAMEPDVVVVAVGARPKHCEGAVDALAVIGGAPVEGRVLVVGAREEHVGPLVTADVLAHRGHSVTLIGEAILLGQATEPATLYALTRRLRLAGVAIEPLTRLVSYAGGVAQVMDTLSGEARTIAPVDTLVWAGPREPRRALAARLAGRGPEINRIGDCLEVRRIVHASLEGARLGAVL